MASSQSMLEQILSAALSSSGVRNAAPGGAPAEGAGNLDDVLGGLLGGSPQARRRKEASRVRPARADLAPTTDFGLAVQ